VRAALPIGSLLCLVAAAGCRTDRPDPAALAAASETLARVRTLALRTTRKVRVLVRQNAYLEQSREYRPVVLPRRKLLTLEEGIRALLELAEVEVVPPGEPFDGVTIEVRASARPHGGVYEKIGFQFAGAEVLGTLMVSVSGARSALFHFEGRESAPEFSRGLYPEAWDAPYLQAVWNSRFERVILALLDQALGPEVLIRALDYDHEYEPVNSGVPEERLTTPWCVRHSALELLEPKGEAVREALVSALSSPDGRLRRGAVRAGQLLAGWREPRTVEPLIGALKDDDLWVVRFAVEALGALGDPRAIEPLLVLLGDAWVTGRLLAAARAGIRPDRVEVDVQGVRRAGVSALGRLGDRRAVRPLVGLLRTPPDASPTLPPRREIAAALRALTGAELGEESGPWEDWLKANGRP
jgi:hypothetical protein